MGCGMSIGAVAKTSAVREERGRSRTLPSANSAGRSSSRGTRAKKHIQLQTLLKLWPSFFLKSCKSSADHAIGSGLMSVADAEVSSETTLISIACLTMADMLTAHVDSEGLMLDGRQTTQQNVEPGALQLYLELYTIKRRLASMGLFDLAAVTLKRLLLAPDQQETWGDWVESLLEATFGDEEEDGGGAVLRKQLVQVGRDICIVVKSLAASSSPQFFLEMGQAVKELIQEIQAREPRLRRKHRHIGRVSWEHQPPIGRLSIPAASSGVSAPAPSPETLSPESLPPSPESLPFFDPPEDFSPEMHTGDTFRWHSGRRIGAGGYGFVSLAWDADSGREMAVKTVERGSEPGGKEETRVLREISIMRGLQHPHVVPFLGTEVSDDGSSILIFMEYARDGNLAEYARRDGGLGEVEAGWCLEQVVYGLSYLHNNRIIHRDIKGANCLVYFLGEGGDRGGSSGNFSKHLRPRIKLADFGSAKALASMVTATGENRTLQGTVNWMPPEVVLGERVGRSADIWSLGCLAIELLSGKPPWTMSEGPQLQQVTIMYKVAKTGEHPPLPPSASDQAGNFMLVCLQKDPAKRPSARNLMACDWFVEHGGGASSPWIAPAPFAPKHEGGGRRLLRGIGDGTGSEASSRTTSMGSNCSTSSAAPSAHTQPTRKMRAGVDTPMMHVERVMMPPPSKPGTIVGGDGVFGAGWG